VIQGNFLSKSVHDELKKMLADPHLGMPSPERQIYADKEEELRDRLNEKNHNEDNAPNSYIDLERHASSTASAEPTSESSVDIVLSDMCEPWPQEHYFWLRSVNDPYIRMQNTSGLAVRDHGASMVWFLTHSFCLFVW
jgi:21S rRNA (uridine2791-2'-O)-methyltransferase